MNFLPLGDRIIVKPLEAEAKTKGGIVLPDTVKEKPQEGKVVAVADYRLEGDKKKPMQVKAGNKVLYAKYGGDEIKIDNEEYLIVKEEDILAIIK